MPQLRNAPKESALVAAAGSAKRVSNTATLTLTGKLQALVTYTVHHAEPWTYDMYVIRREVSLI